MHGYERILELFDAWDKRGAAIPFSELDESLRHLISNAPTLPEHWYLPTATIAASPSVKPPALRGARALLEERPAEPDSQSPRFIMCRPSRRGPRDRDQLCVQPCGSSCPSGRGPTRREA